MFAMVREAKKYLKQAVAELDPEVLESKTEARLVEEFSEIERVAAAGKALAARRMADSGVWRRDGARSAADWMAQKTGTSVGQAVNTLETAPTSRRASRDREGGPRRQIVRDPGKGDCLGGRGQSFV
ncbi:MAG: hypothetical protein ABR505_00230 [Actinomycetota bacterium]